MSADTQQKRKRTFYSLLQGSNFAVSGPDIPDGKTSGCWKALCELQEQGVHSFWVSTHTCPPANTPSDSRMAYHPSSSSGSACLTLPGVPGHQSLHPCAGPPRFRTHFFPPTGKSISRNTCVLMLRNAVGSAWIKHQMGESQKLGGAVSEFQLVASLRAVLSVGCPDLLLVLSGVPAA